MSRVLAWTDLAVGEDMGGRVFIVVRQRILFSWQFSLVFLHCIPQTNSNKKVTMGNTSTSPAESPEAAKVTEQTTSSKALPSECPMHQKNAPKKASVPSECLMNQSNIDIKDAFTQQIWLVILLLLYVD